MKFFYRNSGWKLIRNHIIKKLIGYNKNQKNFFCPIPDSISRNYMVDGNYEIENVKLIRYIASHLNCKDFFWDIGANIGLISCQVGDVFDQVRCYEPNPVLHSILDVNLSIAGLRDRSQILPYALVEKEEPSFLSIPDGNIGGAAISNNNVKDVCVSGDIHTADTTIEIDTKHADDEIRLAFEGLVKKGHKRGCIKIDVEGSEEPILRAVARHIPEDFHIYVVFENWHGPALFTKLWAISEASLTLYKYDNQIAQSKFKNILFKVLRLLLTDLQYSVTKCKENEAPKIGGIGIIELSKAKK